MVIISHDNKRIIEVYDVNHNSISLPKTVSLTRGILELAKNFPNELMIWHHQELKAYVDVKAINDMFHHKHILATFNTDFNYYLSSRIEYLERSICLKFNKDKTYGTYLMSSQVGGMFAQTILKFKDGFNLKMSWVYNLNSLAKNYQQEGLFCYSEPKLLCKQYPEIKASQISNSNLFKFVKEHYKWVWTFVLFISILIYEKKALFFPLLKACFVNRKAHNKHIDFREINSTRAKITNKGIDVIIPTIGRKPYLLNVLKDLASQTILPKQVVIVEQNGDENASTDLDYLKTIDWPFQITHTFTHILGVCNARNVALNSVKNDWVFFADDDIRFHNTLFEDTFEVLNTYGTKALNYSCLQPQQKQTYFNTGQTFIFGSGSSFVSSSIISSLKFDKSFEFGFGEDTDFGARIRQLGYDVTFTGDINLEHLKAPVGGFRKPIKKAWEGDVIQPKPSPTMQLLCQKHYTTNQIKGYKLFLFLEIYGKSNPFKLLSNIKKFNKTWERSIYYSKKISQQSHA